MEQVEALERIRTRAKELTGYTAANLSRLIRIPSLSCQEGDAAAEFGRQMEEAQFDDVAVDRMGNVIGRIGRGHRLIALDAHLDTVDVGVRDNWAFDPYSGELRNGEILGRGSVDQKGGAAAIVTAGRILKELDLLGDVTLLGIGSVMEEDCDGLCWRYIIEEDTIRPELVISTEPTNLGLYRGQRGRMEIEAAFRGLSADGSTPERGRNAIYMASRACLAIEQLNEHLASDGFLGRGSITVTRILTESPSHCRVADQAMIHLDRRLTWGETKGSALQEVQGIVNCRECSVSVPVYRARSYTGLEYGMEKYFPSWMLPEDHPAMQRGAQVYRGLFDAECRFGKWGFSTNGVMINGRYGIPTIGFGPGDETMAHAPNERTPVSDLTAAASFYAAYADAFAREGERGADSSAT